MRKSFALILTALLLASIAANAMLVSRLATLKRTSQWEIARAGKSWGMRIAQRDFADGHPAYYARGKSSASGYPAMLPGKPGRVVIGLGCLAWPFDESFVQAYNQHMDGLFAARQQPQTSKP